MAVPKRRQSKSRSAIRRAQVMKQPVPHFVPCPREPRAVIATNSSATNDRNLHAKQWSDRVSQCWSGEEGDKRVTTKLQVIASLAAVCAITLLQYSLQHSVSLSISKKGTLSASECLQMRKIRLLLQNRFFRGLSSSQLVSNLIWCQN